MPRVLIADDNSNVQKTVTLALKDAGIEVIAVGNGEAAVRKMPEVNPDLVLADIFMPVRNGYEVCEFIKRDPRHMNTPVILLVGAFDPLDEREAQRVQADGVLKKPFVPPDPLVNLVTALLAKSAAAKAILAVPASTPAVQPAAAPPAKDSKPAPAPAVKAEVKTEDSEPVQEQPEEIVNPPAAVISADAAETLAFSSLLEAPAPVSGDEADPIVTASRDPSLGEPAFWTSPPVPEATAEELTEGHAWEENAPRHSAPPMLGPEEPEEIQAAEKAQSSASEELPDVAVEFDAPQEAVENAQETGGEPSAPLVDTSHWTEAPADAAEAELPVEVAAAETTAELAEAVTPPEIAQAESAAPSAALESRESAWRRWAAETTAAPDEAASTEVAPGTELESLAEVQPEAEAISEAKAAEHKLEETAIVVTGDEAEHQAAPEPAEPAAHAHTDAHTGAEPAEVFAFAAAPPLQPASLAADVPAVVGSSAAAIAVLSAVETARPASEALAEAPAVAASEPLPAAVATAQSAPVEEPKTSSSTACEKKVELLAVHEDLAAMDELWKSAEPAFPWTRAEPAAAAVDNSSEAVGSKEVAGSGDEVVAAGEVVAPSEVVASSDVIAVGMQKEAESEPAAPVAAAAIQESKAAEAPAPLPVDSRLQDPEFLEAVVERVIGRMQPRMIEIVTQEILRPVVEAMIRRELEKPQPEQNPK